MPQYDDAQPTGPGFTAGRPKMPKDLSPVAEAEWKRMTKQLLKRGTLTSVDASSLEVYVRMFSRWKKAAELAEENPTTETEWTDSQGTVHTKVVENPASKIAARLEISLRAYQKEFSATPASRDKAKRAAPPVSKVEYPEGSVGWIQANRDRLLAEQEALQPVPIEQEPAPVVAPMTPEQEAGLTNFEE